MNNPVQPSDSNPVTSAGQDVQQVENDGRQVVSDAQADAPAFSAALTDLQGLGHDVEDARGVLVSLFQKGWALVKQGEQDVVSKF